MAGGSRQKQKLLTMKDFFEHQTDENHAVTGNRLIDYLSDIGIKAERKTIYNDIKTLCGSGMDIEIKKDGHSNAYYLGERLFQDEELFVLADAVASCRFLTKKKSQELIRKIQKLTSDYKATRLKRSIYVEKRAKNFNEQIYYAINKIQEGIFENKEITFKYSQFTPDKKVILKHNGEIYRVSPYSLVWENENYYLICYCTKHNKICRYRVDRMLNVSTEKTERKKLTDEENEQVTNLQSLYGMYGGELESVTMRFDNSLANAVMDRFGTKLHTSRDSESTFRITADVQIAPTFWGWFFQFGNKAKILGPETVVEAAKKEIAKLADCYK